MDEWAGCSFPCFWTASARFRTQCCTSPLFFERFRTDYYRLLLAVSQRGRWNEWIAFFLLGVAEQSIDAVERAHQLVELRARWAAQLQTARTSALLLRLIDELFRNPFINLRRAVAVLGVRAQSAQNTIERLIALDVLSEITGRQRNRVYMARRVLDILEQVPAFESPED